MEDCVVPGCLIMRHNLQAGSYVDVVGVHVHPDNNESLGEMVELGLQNMAETTALKGLNNEFT